MKRWTPKLAVARSRRKLDAAKALVTGIALEWGDIDQSFVDRAEDLIGEIEDFADEIRDVVKERLDAGEHVGL